MQVTCVLLFLSCFFNAITCLDVLPASWNPSGQNSTPRERSLYDIAAERRALIKWDQRIDANRYSRPVTLLRSLIIELGGPERITSAEDLTLTTTITNTGSKPLMLLNDPSGVLYSRHPTDRFHVTHSTTGIVPRFKGVQVKFSARKAIELGDVTILRPGQSTSVIHDLSEAYDFTVTGFGHYNFQPRNRFFVVNPTTKRVSMVQAGSIHGTSVYWSASQLVARDGSGHDFVIHHHFVGKISSYDQLLKEAFIDFRLKVANNITLALDYLHRLNHDASAYRYVYWFGTLDSYTPTVHTRLSKVIETLMEMLKFAYSANYKIKEFCSGTIRGHKVVIIGNWVTICPGFFRLKGNEQAFALISAWTHPKLGEYGQGQWYCEQLARNFPVEAVMNANSFKFFITNNQPYIPFMPKTRTAQPPL